MYHIHDGTPAKAARIFGVIGDKCFLKSGLTLDAIGSWVGLIADDVDAEAKERRVNPRNVVLERVFKAAKHLSRGMGSYGHVFNKLGKSPDQLLTLSTSSSVKLDTLGTQSDHRNLLIVIDDFDALDFDSKDGQVDIIQVLMACLLFRPFPSNTRVLLGFSAMDALKRMLNKQDLVEASYNGTEMNMDRGVFTDIVGIWANLTRAVCKNNAEFDRIVRKYQPRSVTMHMFTIPELSSYDIESLAKRRANLAGGKTIDVKYVDVLKESECCKNPFIASYIVDFLITRGTFENMQELLETMMEMIKEPVDVVRHQIIVMETDYEYIEKFYSSAFKVIKARAKLKKPSSAPGMLQVIIEDMHLTDRLQIEHVESAWRSLCRETLLFHVQTDGSCVFRQFATPALEHV